MSRGALRAASVGDLRYATELKAGRRVMVHADPLRGPMRRVNIPAARVVLGATWLAMPATTAGEPRDGAAC
jgi:hypothetical protein